MATKLQIARAKARVSLASASGKKLPDDIVKTAALKLSDAEDYGSRQAPRDEKATAPQPSAAASETVTAYGVAPTVPPGYRATLGTRRIKTFDDEAFHQEAVKVLREFDDSAPVTHIDSGTVFVGQSKASRRDQTALWKFLREPRLPVVDLERHALEVADRASRDVVLYGEHDAVSGATVWHADPPRNTTFDYIGMSTGTVDRMLSLVEYAVRRSHRAMVDAPTERPSLPVDDEVRRSLAQRLARDIVSMHPEYARMIAHAIEDELTMAETIDAAEDARLG